jgi:hypothetical protein
MCYSEEVSLATFSIGLGFSILLILTDVKFNKLLGYFLGFVSLMQFIEYLLWRHPVCDDYNKSVSLIGMILNHAQPVVLAIITGLLYNKQIGSLVLICAVYLAVIIPYSLQFTEDLRCSTRQCGATDPHLVWNWNSLKNNESVYLVFLAAFALIGLLGMPISQGVVFSSVAVLTYGLSSIVYDRKVMGSLWCFWTAFIPAVAYGGHICF